MANGVGGGAQVLDAFELCFFENALPAYPTARTYAVEGVENNTIVITDGLNVDVLQVNRSRENYIIIIILLHCARGG